MNRDNICLRLDRVLDSYTSIVRSLPDATARENFIWSDIWRAIIWHTHTLGQKFHALSLKLTDPWIPSGEVGMGTLENPVNIAWLGKTSDLVVTENSQSRIVIFDRMGVKRSLDNPMYKGARLWQDKSTLWIACDAGRRLIQVNEEFRSIQELDYTKMLPDRDEALHLIQFAVHKELVYFIMQNRKGNRRMLHTLPIGNGADHSVGYFTDVLLWPRQFSLIGDRLILTDQYIPIQEELDVESVRFREKQRLVFTTENRGYCVEGNTVTLAMPAGLIVDATRRGTYIPVEKLASRANIRALSATPDPDGFLAVLDVNHPRIRFYSKI